MLGSIHTASAQFSDSTHYLLNATSSGAINKANDGASYLLNNAAKFGIRKKSVSLNATGSWVYGQSNESLTNNDVNTALDFNIYKTIPHFFYWGLANYTSSYSLKVNNQFQTGAGVAYNFIDKPDALLNLSNGILYENSDLVLEDTLRDVYNTVRNSFRLLFRYSYKNMIVLNGSGFLQNSLKSQSDYIIKANASLAFKFNRWISLTTAVTYNKFNRTRRENLQFTYGLTLERYF